MGQPIPSQHPSVVLRSHYKAVRALLVVAMAALIALSAAVVILADDDHEASTSATQSSAQEQTLPAGTRFDGGPDEGTRGPQAYPLAPGTRFDGGPDEGTRGPQPASDGFKDRAGGPTIPLGGTRP